MHQRQTFRMLTQLLNKGSAGAPIVEDASTNPLFAGGKDWVSSITTISTPNQGTTLANGFSEIGDTVKNLLVGVLSVLNIGGSTTEMIYDAKLDQWGLTAKAKGESLQTYINRVFSSSIFKPGFKDVCLWSLSTQGAAEENTWVKTLPNVYYFSYSTSDTFATRDFFLRKIQLPNLLTMILPMQPLGVFLGGRYAPNNGLSTDWQENDGVVPSTSMSKDSTGPLVVFGGSSQIGKWNQMPQLDHLDHLAVVGITLHTQVKDLYVSHAQLLASLPVDAGNPSIAKLLSTSSSESTSATLNAVRVDAALTSLSSAAESVQTLDDLKRLCETPANLFAANYCVQMIHKSETRRLRGTHP